MKRRFLCALLTLVMIITMIPAMNVHAEDTVTLKTSEKAIRLLKKIEGFSAKAYYDHSHYSIGYGTTCQKNEYPNGITESEADALMRAALAEMEVSVDKFVKKYSLDLTTNQYDALMLFTYNLGSGWTSNNSDFRSAVINGLTGNDFIYYITRWCTASGAVSTGLIERRLAEADLYLYGYYSTEAPSNYSYVLFDGNGGTSTSTIQGYDACQPDAVRATAEYTGYRFMGWYTKAEGGKWVSHVDATTKGLTLYAHWQSEEEELDENGNVTGTAVSYTRITSSELEAYDAPSNDAEKMESVAANTSVKIVADYVDADGVKWGMLEDCSWIILTDTTVTLKADEAPERPVEEEIEEEEQEQTTSAVQVLVTGTNVNYRKGPGTSYSKLGTLSYGTSLTITEVQQVGNAKWGKFSNGWVCLTYTNYDAVIASQGAASSGETVIATGTIVNCSSLRIRSGAGTSYSVAGTLTQGTKVSIYEIVTAGVMKWGRISNGWISLSYVDLTYVSGDTSGDSTGNTTSGPVTGVVTATRLNVRSGAGTSYKTVASLTQGTTVTITEQKTVSGLTWGKMDKGWVCMSYIRVTGSADTGTGDTSTDTDTDTDTGSASDGITGTVNATNLRVRSGAGTSYSVVTTLSKGTKVTVTQQTLAGGLVWGRIEQGWICMSYVTVTSGSTNVECTGMVTATALSIRSAAGTGNAIVGRYVRGTVVTIYEITTVGATLWGRTDKGWICLDYVSY